MNHRAINRARARVYAPSAFAAVLAASFLIAHGAEAQQTATAELEGTVSNVSGTCPALRFTVAAKSVVTHSGTDFEDGTCADIVNGRRVEVEGEVQADGSLVAREVDFD